MENAAKVYRKWLGRLGDLKDCFFDGDGWLDGELELFRADKSLAHVHRHVGLAHPERLWRNHYTLRAKDLDALMRRELTIALVNAMNANTLLCYVEADGQIDFPFPTHDEANRRYFLLNVEWQSRTRVVRILDLLAQTLGCPVLGRPTIWIREGEREKIRRGDRVELPRVPCDRLYALKPIPVNSIPEYYKAQQHKPQKLTPKPKRQVRFCVPANINKIISEMPEDLKKYGDYVKLLFSTIRLRWTLWQADEEGYIRLNVDILRQLLWHEKERDVRYWLIHEGHLEQVTKDCGREGKGSYRYRVNPDIDLLDWHFVPCTDKKLADKIRAHRRGLLREDVHLHLEKNLSRVQIDVAAAEKIAREIDDELLLRNEELQWSRNIELIQMIAQGIHSPSVCAFGRFHSVFTRLPKRLRSTLSVEGQPLVFVDVRNSQPLLLALMAVNRAIHGDIVDYTTFSLNSGAKKEKKRPGGGDPTHTPITPQVLGGFLSQDLGATALNARKNLKPDELAYLEVCERGEFYEDLMDWSCLPFDRDQFKQLVYRDVFFGNGNYDCQLVDAFRSRYPTIYEMILDIRRRAKTYKAVSQQMQRLESNLIINTVCKRLMEEQPEMPIITIHDCIATTPAHVENVKKVMIEEYTKLGIRPTLAIQ